MNWGRGFFRLWIFATLLWCVLVTVTLGPGVIAVRTPSTSHDMSLSADRKMAEPAEESSAVDIAEKIFAPVLGLARAEESRPPLLTPVQTRFAMTRLHKRILFFAATAFIPPWAALLLGCSVLWIIQGFRREKPNDVTCDMTGLRERRAQATARLPR